jgi:predicted DNA-binding protein (MmcQ/YjbR family)
MESTLQERINIGRQYEEHCYSLCYYLLQDEKLAIKAAQEVMKRLIENDSFNSGSHLNIAQYIKKESMKESVQVIYSKE